MKHKKILLLALLSTLTLGGCTPKKTDPDEGKINPMNQDIVGDEYDSWANSWSKPGHLYFHYYRGADAQDYNNYALWLWPFFPDSLEGTLWGFPADKVNVSSTLTLRPMSNSFMTLNDVGLTGDSIYCDNFGIIFDVDLESTNLVGGKTGKPVSFEGSTEIGFLLPNINSMNGEKNWESDGSIENYIDDFRKEENWRSVSDGKALHIFTQTGSLDEVRYFAGSGNQEPVKNPVDTDTTGVYRSKMESLPLSSAEVVTDNDFKSIGVGYQIFVASFRDSDGDGMGDIRGIIDALDYLDDLGVKCLWLTPIQKSGSYHGYDTIDYKAVDKRFGTMEDYEELLQKAHSRGMTVLMDLVLNHTSKANEWFKKSKLDVKESVTLGGETISDFHWRDVYTWKYKEDKITKPATIKKVGTKWEASDYREIPVYEDAESTNPSWYKDGESNYYYYGKFGSGMPEINYESANTRKLIKDVAKFWLDKGLDGFRLDAVKHIYMLDEYSDKDGKIKDASGNVINFNGDQSGYDVCHIIDVGEKSSYDDEKGKYVTKKYDYSSNLTKNVSFWRDFAHDLKEYNKTRNRHHCFLVGENFDGWGTRTAPYYQALDSQFDFSNYYHVPAWIYNTEGGASSFDGDSGQAYETYIPFASNDTYSVGGTTDVKGGGRPDFINGAFTSNHDVMRLINQACGEGNKDSTTANTNVEYNDPIINGKAKFQAAVTILNPGLSWIYYGDELGMSSNTFEHIEKYGSENNEDIWYRQPFLWKNKSSRANYKSGQYVFELDEHNRHIVNNGEGIDYREVKDASGKVTGHTISTESTFYSFYKVINSIKNKYPAGAHIKYEYSSENVLRIVVMDASYNEQMIIFLNNGRNKNEYKMLVDTSAYKYSKATEGVPKAAGGNIGASLYGVTAFSKTPFELGV